MAIPRGQSISALTNSMDRGVQANRIGWKSLRLPTRIGDRSAMMIRRRVRNMPTWLRNRLLPLVPVHMVWPDLLPRVSPVLGGRLNHPRAIWRVFMTGCVRLVGFALRMKCKRVLAVWEMPIGALRPSMRNPIWLCWASRLVMATRLVLLLLPLQLPNPLLMAWNFSLPLVEQRWHAGWEPRS